MQAIELKCTEYDAVEINSFDGNKGSNWHSITKLSVKLGKKNDYTVMFNDLDPL
jgi:hypothetical protein